MTPHVLNMPEQPNELAKWLESHLLGLHLGELVAELQAVHGQSARDEGGSLDEALGSELSQVLTRGLSALSPTQITKLLTKPTLLPQLQERVFLEGGAYWRQTVPTPPEVTRRVEAQWQRLEQILQEENAARPAVTDSPRTQSNSALTWWRHPLFVSLATAAAVLLAVSPKFAPPPQAVTTWGWNKPDALANRESPSAYLQQLANGAKEWTNQRPKSREELLDHLAQFRNGCARLILAEHGNLASADRDWLRENCRSWAAKLDIHRQNLESCAAEDVFQVRSDIDATVEQLADRLEERSHQLQST